MMTHEKLKQKALERPGVKAAYIVLEAEFANYGKALEKRRKRIKADTHDKVALTPEEETVDG